MQGTEHLFQSIFDQMTEPRIVVLPNNPDFTIVAINKAYKAATGYTSEDLNNQSIWDLFKVDGASANVRAIFEAGLNDAIRHRAEIKLPIFRFDNPATASTKAQPRWWQVDIAPVNGPGDELLYLVCTTRNVTLHVEDQATILQGEQDNAALLIRQQEQIDEADRAGERNKELSESEYRLNRIVDTTPIGLSIIKGRKFVIETVNDPLLRLWGRRREHIIGRELLSVFPELKDQVFISLLNQVFNTRKSIQLTRQPAVIADPAGELRHVFIDFSYDPLFDHENQVDAVLVTINDVTDIVKMQQLLQDREEELEVFNEELSATNEELHATNEELHAKNDQLTAANKELEKLKGI